MSGTGMSTSPKGNRRYTPLPFEYLEEMELLSDEEYGRLIRALQRYSIRGDIVKCPGPESFYYKRVINREDRFHKEFEEIQKQRSCAGKKGAKVRWGTDKKEEVSENQIFFEPRLEEVSYGKNGNTKAEAETKTETETHDIPAEAGKYPGESGASASAIEITEDFCRLVKAKLYLHLSETARKEFAENYACLGTELFQHAVERCREEGRLNWSYLRGILKNMKKCGVVSVEQDHFLGKIRSAKLQERSPVILEQSVPSYQSHEKVTLTPLERLHMEEILKESE